MAQCNSCSSSSTFFSMSLSLSKVCTCSSSFLAFSLYCGTSCQRQGKKDEDNINIKSHYNYYSWEIGREFNLTVWQFLPTTAKLKICQYFLHAYVCMTILYHTAKFKFCSLILGHQLHFFPATLYSNCTIIHLEFHLLINLH